MAPTSPHAKCEHLLAIETSARTGSVAIVARTGQESTVVAEQALDPTERTARSLHPTIHQLLQQLRLAPGDLHGIAVTVGPGSFTGLRIGVTAAKTLAYATQCPVVALNTLDVVASQSRPTGENHRRLWVVMNAERGDLFAACHSLPLAIAPGSEDRTRLVASQAWLAELQMGDLVSGPAATRYADQFPDGVTLSPAESHAPRAAAVGQLGWQWLAAGCTTDPFALLPNYYRTSAAEEKAAKQPAQPPRPTSSER